jgi:hypothetical protein
MPGVDAACNCGAPLVPAGGTAPAAIKANPKKSDRMIAKELEIGKSTVLPTIDNPPKGALWDDQGDRALVLQIVWGREVIRQNKVATPMSPTTPTQTSTCDMLAYSNPNAIGLLNTGGSELFRAEAMGDVSRGVVLAPVGRWADENSRHQRASALLCGTCMIVS